ncbi:hypothetical protein D3C86_2061750 [compost metagenome]
MVRSQKPNRPMYNNAALLVSANATPAERQASNTSASADTVQGSQPSRFSIPSMTVRTATITPINAPSNVT